ncbi:glycoside hydrolase family 1 protein [Thorsellia anophelis]|uniref:6-phospho-beta-glucosidase n=1 Tax=Thorsellia anophelis DSM 18579 TaxID=1123402 RepID=A0A1I0AEB8_9GAMM|nr:glycoside hydrolase family 1 protein [Thorsellia anophelis]SES92530.1 6-phospho-beta-glucosidase [Thorsellia anophelis DSM 18579]
MQYQSISPLSKQFLWGAATAAYQCEGAKLEDGKGLSIVDLNINPKFADTSVTTDHYHRYKEDVALMKELGLKAYRFSIAWPRIFPNGDGIINQKGLDFYRNLIDELVKNGIEPLVTLYHFDLPKALQDKYQGWSSRQVIDDFFHFSKTVIDEFSDSVTHWFTINEQSNMFALPYLLVFDENDTRSIEEQKYQMNHYMTVAHAKVVEYCRTQYPSHKIGPAIGLSPYYAASALPEDVLATQVCADFKTYFFMDLYFKGEYKANIWKYILEQGYNLDILEEDLALMKSAKPNLLGINYYQSTMVRACPETEVAQDVAIDENGAKQAIFETAPGRYQVIQNPNLNTTPWGWEIDPIGLRILLNDIYARYPVPIIITENGIGGQESLDENNTVDDSYRIEYLSEHLDALTQSVNDGVDVVGYCPWSFMDLLSTSSGFNKRYGFVYVNRTDKELLDLARYKKKSFYWYQSLIQSATK